MIDDLVIDDQKMFKPNVSPDDRMLRLITVDVTRYYSTTLRPMGVCWCQGTTKWVCRAELAEFESMGN